MADSPPRTTIDGQETVNSEDSVGQTLGLIDLTGPVLPENLKPIK